MVIKRPSPYYRIMSRTEARGCDKYAVVDEAITGKRKAL